MVAYASCVTSAGIDLIGRIRAGDEGAVNDLYDRYAAPLLALAHRIIDDRADAEDVVLEALARAWREAGRFDPTRGSVRAWLTVMVRSRALDLVRARDRRHAMAGAAAAADFPAASGAPPRDPARAAEVADDRRNVLSALEQLSPPQREAIELAYFDGLSQTQIAERVGAPLGTIKTRIRDGMRKLRSALLPLYVESNG